jgi:hypothetical protein
MQPKPADQHGKISSNRSIKLRKEIKVKPAAGKEGGKSKRKGSKATINAKGLDTTPCSTYRIKYCVPASNMSEMVPQCQGLEENLSQDQIFFFASAVRTVKLSNKCNLKLHMLLFMRSIINFCRVLGLYVNEFHSFYSF